MHKATDMRAPPIRIQSGSARRNAETSSGSGHACDSLWLLYCRLLGIPTLLCMALATVLHQCVCSLGSEPSHWGAAWTVIGLCHALATLLWAGKATRAQLFGSLSAGICVCVLWLAWQDELCEMHRCFAWTIGAVSLSACSLAVTGNMTTQTTIGNKPSPLAAAGSDPQSTFRPATGSPDQGLSQPLLNAPEDAAELPANEQSDPPAAASVRSTRPTWAKYAVAVLLLTGFMVYMIVVPTVSLLWERLNPNTSIHRELTDMSLGEVIRLQAVSGMVMFIFLAIGASVGSFLNVVIYRLPRYRALLWPPSSCPGCQTRIAGKDNIPILSWLRLGGCCRHCGVNISPRYPLVEAVVATFFVLFYYRELLSGGQNLPVRPHNLYNGIVWILLYTKWDLVSLYVCHMALLTWLLAWGLINYDRFRVPGWSVGLSVAGFAALIAAFPQLNPVLSQWDSWRWLGELAWPPVALFGAVGWLSGWMLELAAGRLQSNNSSAAPQAEEAEEAELPELDSSTTAGLEQPVELSPVHDLYGSSSSLPARRSDAASSLALVGIVLGGEALLCVVCLTTSLLLVSFVVGRWKQPTPSRLDRRYWPVSFMVFLAACVTLWIWVHIYSLLNWTMA